MSIDARDPGTVTTDAGPDGRSAAGDAVITRLNAFDGLFLRAEHLNRMQDYALQLGLAYGRALGSGVVEGFGIGLDGDTLVADPGLAIDPAGRPLHTRHSLRISLAALTPAVTSVWWVEVQLDEQEFGDEPVRGVACADPCQDGQRSGRHPYIAEGVRLSVREEKLPAPAEEASLDRRGWVAHRAFDRERPALGVWPGVVPADVVTASGEPTFLERWWRPLPAGRDEGIGRPDNAVPIGLLLPATTSGQTWELDTWTARRDLGEARPQQAWLPLLAMRPWPVFVAQILQFQQLLADRAGSGGSATPMTVADLDKALGELSTELRSRRTSKPLEIAQELQGWLRGIAPAQAVQAWSLPQLGLRWLPPALFLPVARELPVVSEDGASVESEVARMLDRAVEGALSPTICICGPWEIGRVLELTRHADRIDLDNRQTPLRVYVPAAGEDARLTDWVLVVADALVRCQSREGGGQIG